MTNIPIVSSTAQFSLFKNSLDSNFSIGSNDNDVGLPKLNNNGSITLNSTTHLVKKHNHRAKQIRNVVSIIFF